MTIRIERQLAEDETVIGLHGWLSAAEVPELERVAAEDSQSLRIELGQLAGADRAGLRALHRQQGRGARLTGASPYVELLMKGTAGASDGEEGG